MDKYIRKQNQMRWLFSPLWNSREWKNMSNDECMKCGRKWHLHTLKSIRNCTDLPVIQMEE